jgi:hypothetical protein
VEQQVLASIDVEQQDNALNLGQGAQDVFVLVVVRIRGIKEGGYDGGDGEIEDVLKWSGQPRQFGVAVMREGGP